jgi:hypothetical protein
VILELRWAQVAERGAEPPGVVRRRQEGKIGGDIREGFVAFK